METTNPTNPYTTRADKYARYRWDYAPQAIQTILATTGIGADACMADIGSGTGILARHFVERVHCLYAVEPDGHMRAWAEQALACHPSFRSVAGTAEVTTLPDHAVDLIAVGQALHWFEPDAARAEFTRILKPAGWLAVVWNYGTDPHLGEAMREVCSAENGWDASPSAGARSGQPPEFYYRSEQYLQQSFPMTGQENWESFFGALCSDSHAPDEDHPSFDRFMRAARQVFDRFCADGRVTVHFTTQLCLGQM
ncbi:MAG: class I SAM-dependent methyltransferase [Chloroflexi bacterium]|nr:class I SAM-dependent methyltransferase [Chloroflexota bacterium]